MCARITASLLMSCLDTLLNSSDTNSSDGRHLGLMKCFLLPSLPVDTKESPLISAENRAAPRFALLMRPQIVTSPVKALPSQAVIGVVEDPIVCKRLSSKWTLEL